jgi:hypothetical protein
MFSGDSGAPQEQMIPGPRPRGSPTQAPWGGVVIGYYLTYAPGIRLATEKDLA